MPKVADRNTVAPRDVDGEEAARLFDAQARKLMNMSGQEFVDRYDAGEFDSAVENTDVTLLEIILPFAEKLRNGRRHR